MGADAPSGSPARWVGVRSSAPSAAWLQNVVDVTPKWDQSSVGLGVIMDRIEQGFVVTAWVMIAAAAIYLIW
jgi:hypothetical protein